MNPGLPALPASGSSGAAPTGRTPAETESDTAQLDVFLQLLVGLAPVATPVTLPGLPSRTSGEGLPPGGSALPAKGEGEGRAGLKFLPAKPLTDSLAVSAGQPEAVAASTPQGKLLQEGAATRATLEAALGQLGRQAGTVSPADAGTLASALPLAPPAPGVTAAPDVAARPALPAPVVTSPSFADAVSGRVQWLAQSGQQFARIDLNPAHLGPLEIHIQMDGDRAQVMFGAQHAVTREALETAVPRLREMLGQSGLQLVQVNVGQQGMGDPRQGGFSGMPGGGFTQRGAAEHGVSTGVSDVSAITRRGLVDDYA